MSVAALVALVHDVVITIGVYALSGLPGDAGGRHRSAGDPRLLALRHRRRVRQDPGEHHRRCARARQTYAEAANLAVNQTLVRSINTCIVALIPIGAILYVSAVQLGASSLQDLALAQFVGMAAGVYSSVFLAPRVLVHLKSTETEVVLADAPGQGAGAARRPTGTPRCRRSPRTCRSRDDARTTPEATLDDDRRRRAGRRRRRRQRPSAPEAAGRGPGRPDAARARSAQSRSVRPAAADAAARVEARQEVSRAGEPTRARPRWTLGSVRDVPDFPEPGIVFKDITPLLADHDGFTRGRRRRWPTPGATPTARVGRRQGGRHGGARLHPRRRRSPSRSASGSCPVRKAGKLPARDARRLLRAGVRRGDPRGAPRRRRAGRAGAARRRRARHRRHRPRRPPSWSSACGGDGGRRGGPDGAVGFLPGRAAVGDVPLTAPDRGLTARARPHRLPCMTEERASDRRRSRRARRRCRSATTATSVAGGRGMRARLARMGTRTPAGQPGARAAVPRGAGQPPEGRPGAARARLRDRRARCTAPRCARAATPTSPTRSRSPRSSPTSA